MRIGVDLGGTKIEAVALGTRDVELARRRIKTPAKEYEAIVRAIVDLVGGIERDLGQRGTVGVGTPGAISPATGRIKNSNTTVLVGRPLDRDLEAALGRPVRLENDANCLALSEATDGAAAGAETVFAVILGTGVGGGIAVRGKLLTGANAIAGEWGHNPLPWPTPAEWPGPACYCGKHGCIETFLSGPGFARDYREVMGKRKGAEKIVELAENGVIGAVMALSRYENRLARALASVINILDPDVIVLAGGMSNIRRLFHAIPEIWGKHVFSDNVRTRLVPAKYGDSSGVRGAARLWMDN